MYTWHDSRDLNYIPGIVAVLTFYFSLVSRFIPIGFKNILIQKQAVKSRFSIWACGLNFVLNQLWTWMNWEVLVCVSHLPFQNEEGTPLRTWPWDLQSQIPAFLPSFSLSGDWPDENTRHELAVSVSQQDSAAGAVSTEITGPSVPSVLRKKL